MQLNYVKCRYENSGASLPNTTYILKPMSSYQKELNWQKTEANKARGPTPAQCLLYSSVFRISLFNLTDAVFVMSCGKKKFRKCIFTVKVCQSLRCRYTYINGCLKEILLVVCYNSAAGFTVKSYKHHSQKIFQSRKRGSNTFTN